MAHRRLILLDMRPDDDDEPVMEQHEEPGSDLFPTVLWLALVALGVAAAYAAWRAVMAEGARLSVFAGELVWPGLAIFAVVFAVAVAGWKLDID